MNLFRYSIFRNSLFSGVIPHPEDYRLISGLFLRLLALIYLVAFASLSVQIVGLAGEDGILPIANKLRFLETEAGASRYLILPTLFWIDSSDTALRLVTIAGCLFSILLFLNILQRTSLLVLFVLYLSLLHAGQLFMNFQWDYLLLEASFLAIFLPSGSRTVLFLYRWLLFRFRFLSGLSKLISQDPSWASLTALNYYFEVQPLPHIGSWYAHQLPDWLLKFSTGSALFIELVVPFFMFLPRGPRFFAAWATIFMQVLIMLTSNHNFSNLLTIILCLFLFDDRAVSRIVPTSLAGWLTRRQSAKLSGRPLQAIITGLLGITIVVASSAQTWTLITGRPVFSPLNGFVETLRPFRLTSDYHVFPTMKTDRIELVVEGTPDGVNWYPYVFKYRPGDTARQPELIIPHQPRLDWMMWFVPMGPPFLPWFQNFLYALLDDSEEVMNLLEEDPFPDQKPRAVRVSVYRYRFTTPEARSETDQWWEREYLGPFFPLPWLER